MANNKKQPLITVIIPVYNVEKYLDRCVNSIVNQTYKNLEIILVDDGSTDKSGLMCNEWKKKDERIKVIHIKTNKGVSAARNVGIRNAVGEFVAFCDPDDIYKTEYIEVACNNMKNKGIELFVCGYEVDLNGNKMDINKHETKYISCDDFYEKIFEKNYIGGYVWNKCFKLKLIKEKGIFFDEKIAVLEDLKFVCDYIQYIKKGYYSHNALYVYKQNMDGALESIVDSEKYLTEMNVCEYLVDMYGKIVPKKQYLAKMFYVKTVSGAFYRFRSNGMLFNKYLRVAREYYEEIKIKLSRIERMKLYIVTYHPILYGKLRSFYRKFWR